MNYLTGYLMQMTNYKIINENNIFNFILKTFDHIPNDKKQDYINDIKINIGNSFFDDLKSYTFRKVPKHEILDLMK